MKKILRTLLCALFLFFAWPFFLYKKYGENMRLDKKTIIISNHYSTLDAFFIYLVFHDRNIRYVTIEDVKKRFLSRFICWLFDCLYIDYKTSNLKFFKDCIKILNSGGIICIFPEGVINPAKYGFFDFKNSFVYFARKTGAKILPLYIYPRFKPFAKTIIYIGKIFTTEDYAEYKTLYEASNFFQCKIIEYQLLCEKQYGGGA